MGFLKSNVRKAYMISEGHENQIEKHRKKQEKKAEKQKNKTTSSITRPIISAATEMRREKLVKNNEIKRFAMT